MQKRSTALAALMGCSIFVSTSLARADEPPRPPLVAAIADAPGTDVVVLRNGGTIRGTFIEVLPGDHLTILLASGQTAIVKWIDIARFGDSESAPLPPPEPAPPLAVRNTKSKVVVHIASPRHVTLEHKGVGSDNWDAVCESPCDKSLPRSGGYRISGSDIMASGDFDLQESAEERIVLHVSPATKSAHYGGMITFGVGAVAFMSGAAALSTTNHNSQADTAGGIAVVAGLVTMGIGTYLTLAHWSTGQKQELETPPEAPPRTASLFASKPRETVTPPPVLLGLPIVSGSF